MATRIIISYDGTNNEDDAVVLGRALAAGGADAALAYVRHIQEPEPDRERLVGQEAEALLKRGAELFGDHVACRVVEDRSTPDGLRRLAAELDAQVVVFCSDSHTASGRVSIGNSARRLLEGGPLAVAIAPAGLARSGRATIARIAAVGDGADPGTAATAKALADALHATVVPGAGTGLDVDLLIAGSRPEAQPETLVLSAATENLVEEASCPVLMVPRGLVLSFDSAVSATT